MHYHPSAPRIIPHILIHPLPLSLLQTYPVVKAFIEKGMQLAFGVQTLADQIFPITDRTGGFRRRI